MRRAMRAPRAITHDTMGAVMLIDNGATLVPYGMVAAAGEKFTIMAYVHMSSAALSSDCNIVVLLNAGCDDQDERHAYPRRSRQSGYRQQKDSEGRGESSRHVKGVHPKRRCDGRLALHTTPKAGPSRRPA